MKKSKIIITIVAFIAALALVITGTVLILSSKFKNAPDKDTDSMNSITSSDASENDSNVTTENSDSSSAQSSNNSSVNSQSSSASSTPSVPNINSSITNVIVDNVTANKGDKVSVPVYVAANKGFMGVIAKFQYDTSSLKYKGYKKGDLLTDYEVQESGGEIKFMSIESGDVTKDGIMLYLEFEVISSASKTTPINLTIEDTHIANKAEQYVEVKTVNGSVTIK